jgi:hypothetical protein
MTWTTQNVQNVFWTPKQQTQPLPSIGTGCHTVHYV